MTVEYKEKVMKKNLTEIVVVLDKSGSMNSIREDTIGGFNTFIEDQRKAEDDANITLIGFNQRVDEVYKSIDIKEIDLLTEKNYVPNGMTALYDAIGTAVGTMKEEIAKREEEDRPKQVIVVVITDGFENSSKEYSNTDVKTMIKRMETVHDWSFVYIGANQDAFEVGGGMGFKRRSTMSWDSDAAGSAQMYGTLSKSVKSYRSTGEVKLDADDTTEKK